MKKSFDNKYAIRIGGMPAGAQNEHFLLDEDFFSAFDDSPISDGALSVDLDIFKYDSHIDAKFNLTGSVLLSCDRCMEPYQAQIASEHKIIFSFDEDMNGDEHEIIYIDPRMPHRDIKVELYEFAVLSLPIRNVPPLEEHLCSAEALSLLGLDEKGNVKEQEEEEKEIDPRWEALRKLKSK